MSIVFTAISTSVAEAAASVKDPKRSCTFLPTYPSFVNSTNEFTLLLANIPEYQLNREQYDIRCQYGYHQPTAMKPNDDCERRLAFLSRLWNINYSILDYNLTRLIKLANLIGANPIHRFSIPKNQAYLHEDEYSVALEFFLQIDLHLFYMKTCSYRGAVAITHSSTDRNNLFCITNEPQARYEMNRCQRLTCCLCYPSYKLTYRHDTPIIRFGSHQQHTFLNHYRSILNCPATCQTQNIIYVLTCPCHKVDYIGETSASLSNRLSYHQKHVNRIIQEFLLGPKNITRIRPNIKSNESLVKDNMTLYQHSAHCSSAIQWFLDENPEYWPFIPVRIDETVAIESTPADVLQFIHADDVPRPPAVNYRFTHQQKLQIDQFFYEKKYLNSPNSQLDLYEAAIVIVLPNNASDALRRFIEALFITHAQTKLNTDGHLDQLLFPDHDDSVTMNPNTSTTAASSSLIDEQQQMDKGEEEVWCKNLVRRPSCV